jgi:hypothetical protein
MVAGRGKISAFHYPFSKTALETLESVVGQSGSDPNTFVASKCLGV